MELASWRYGTKIITQPDSIEDAICEWVHDFNYGETFSPGFVDRDRKTVYLPKVGCGDTKSDLALLEEGLDISLKEFQIERFEIPLFS